jgi:Kef-type K+ transport system membrane component KefB
MDGLIAYDVIFGVCAIVILSYLFSILSRITQIPSVLMLLGTGILLKYVAAQYGITIPVRPILIEILGTIGLIMIVLEAGLELEFSKEKFGQIKGAFFSALVIFLVSTVCLIYLFHTTLLLGLLQSAIYAIPLATVSSAIVLPSVAHLTGAKREFLVYEAAFSDIIGIMFFNLVAGATVLSVFAVASFFGGLLLAGVLSVLVSALLMFILIYNRVNVKFFLAFAILIIVYIGGKMLGIPSLITILTFGLVVNNWELVQFDRLRTYFSSKDVSRMADLLKSITAESSFLIRTFFFLLFGLSMDINALTDPEVIRVGSLVILVMIISRFVYLRVLYKYNLFPEVLYSPRGLITVLLFYKIPETLRSEAFNQGILSFVIIASNLIMVVGALLYRKPIEILHDESK